MTVSKTEAASDLYWWHREDQLGLSWQEALAYCEGLDHGGYEDWRLPNINQLRSLVTIEREPPILEDPVIGDPTTRFPGFTIQNYWSSTPYGLSDVDVAWSILFWNGNTRYSFRNSNTLYVVCVREPF